MICERIERRLPDHVTGRLPVAEMTLVEDHLQSCVPCSHLRDDLSRIYSIDPPVGEPMPPVRELAALLSGETEHSRRPWLRVAAISVLAVTLSYAAFELADHPGLSTVEWTALPLPAMTVDMPGLPPDYPATFWIDSEAEALRLAAFTGKPVLEEYVNTGCPRCIHVDRQMDRPENLASLSGFIGLRRTLRQEPPRWVFEAASPREIPFVLPAVRIHDALSGATSRALFSTPSWDYLTILVGEWEEEQKDTLLVPLELEQFEAALRDLRTLPSWLCDGELSLALQRLSRIEALGERHRTAFASVAKDLIAKIRARVAEEIDILRSSTVSDRSQRAQAADLERRLRALLDA